MLDLHTYIHIYIHIYMHTLVNITYPPQTQKNAKWFLEFVSIASVRGLAALLLRMFQAIFS